MEQTIVGIVLASTGFWGLIQLFFTRSWAKKDKNNAEFERLDNKIDDEIKRVHKEADAKIDVLSEATLALLHDRLFQSCNQYLDHGEIKALQLENLEKLFTAYSAMGGNGTCRELMDRCRDLPIKF